MERTLTKAAVREVRAFGWTLGLACGALSLRWAQLHHARAQIAAMALAGALVWLASRVAPAWLRPVERAWMALGKALGRVTTPVLLTAVFALVLVPMRALLWALGRDPLGVRRDPRAGTYWVERAQKGFVREDFERLS